MDGGRGWGPLFSGGAVGHRRRTLVGGNGGRRGGGALAGKVTPDAPIVGELGGNGKKLKMGQESKGCQN